MNDSSCETISLHFGGFGNRIAMKFWDLMRKEHQIDKYGNFGDFEECDQMRIYFREIEKTNQKSFVPRVILVDSETSVLDSIRSSDLGRFFDCDSFISSNSGSGGIWARVEYEISKEIKPMVLDFVRKEVERCDDPRYFITFHSCSGGSGSGLFTSLNTALLEDYPEIRHFTHSLFPETDKCFESVLHPYNTVMSMHYSVENCDMNICYDNSSLVKNSFLSYGKENNPIFEDLNEVVSKVASGVTASQRFGGTQNSSILKSVWGCLVPFPRVHFITPTYVEKKSKFGGVVSDTTDKFNVEEFFKPSNCLLSNVNFEHNNIFGASVHLRGSKNEFSAFGMAKKLKNFKDKNDKVKLHFLNWLTSDHFQISVANHHPKKNFSSKQDRLLPTLSSSSTCLMSHTGIHDKFSLISRQFRSVFREKRFLHWYTSCGMDEYEFIEAESNLNDLISEYNSYGQIAIYEDEGEGEFLT